MVANTKIDELDLTDDRTRELHAEIRSLRGELQAVTEELAAEKAGARSERSGDGITVCDDDHRPPADRNIYVFEDEDETGLAFDDFFAAPDPHLDKVRGFLLD